LKAGSSLGSLLGRVHRALHIRCVGFDPTLLLLRLPDWGSPLFEGMLAPW
jgi:hypothetical protein